MSDLPAQLYSHRSIGIATFLGSPAAGAILIRQNFISLGKEKAGMYALVLGIVVTVGMFILLFMLPDEISSKIPNMALPALYTGLTYALVEKFQGKEIKAHKEQNGKFYSAWRAAGIGFACMVVIFAAVFCFVLYQQPSFDAELYDKRAAQLSQNEAQALQLFQIDPAVGTDKFVEFVRNQGIPNWEKNLELLMELDVTPGLPDALKTRHELLNQYYQLRIQSYRMIEKAATEQTNSYAEDIGKLNALIQEQLNLINDDASKP